MPPPSRLAFNLLFLLFVTLCDCGSRYSQDENEPKLKQDEEHPFRMNNVNLIWEKARKTLSGPRLADLYADLAIQDKAERELKKLKAENRDKNGLKEAEIRERRLDIMKRYGLQGVLPPPPPSLSNEIPLDDLPPNFRDKKLDRMWKNAELSGFTDEELRDLKQEFWHQQHKIDEFNSLKDEGASLDDLNDNQLEFQRGKKEKDNLKDFDKQRLMKIRQKEINERYNRLEAQARDGGTKELEFQDPRVYELWALAKKANMSKEELLSFKTELGHFEQRIRKHEYYQDQLSLTEDMLKDQAKDGEFPEKHKQLKQKAEDFQKKVKKYHSHLRHTVEKALNRHTEL